MYSVPRFWVQMGTCIDGEFQALLPCREGPRDEAKSPGARLDLA